MKLLAIVVVACCFGCGSKGESKGDPKGESKDDLTGDTKGGNPLAGYEALKDRLCACATHECAEDADRKARDWLLEVDNVSASVDPDHAGRFLEIDRALDACAKKLGVGRTASPP